MTWYEILALVGVPAILAFLFQVIFNAIQNHTVKAIDQNEALRYGVQALLRHNLRADYKHYMEQGYIDIADKEDYDNMYQRYHNLGKNGVMDRMHEEVMNLPSKLDN